MPISEGTTTTNYDRWMLYMADCESPNLYLKFGFYAMIAMTLQRRVWIPYKTERCFPNPYVVFYGPPGVGKGRIIRQIIECVKPHVRANGNLSPEDIEKFLNDGKAAPEFVKPMFPILPDSTSLRSLLSNIEKSLAKFTYTPIGADKPKAEAHCSCGFILEELSSLFHEAKETKNVSQFLLNAWDCGDYKHSTEHCGVNEVRNMCVTLICGTNARFMKDILSMGIMDEGLGARTLFICANENRFRKLSIGELMPEQKQARHELCAHLKALYNCNGYCTLSPEAYDYFENWYMHQQDNPEFRLNSSPRLDYYYARKPHHVLKTALAIHFAEQLNNYTITLDDIKAAFNLLHEAEPDMHKAYSGFARNELKPIGDEIVKFIKRRKQVHAKDIAWEFAEQVNKLELNEILVSRCELGQITCTSDIYSYNDKTKREI